MTQLWFLIIELLSNIPSTTLTNTGSWSSWYRPARDSVAGDYNMFKPCYILEPARGRAPRALHVE